MRLRPVLALTLGGVLATACAVVRYEPVSPLAKLEVGFADPAWNGRAIPAGQQCGQFGGKGASPALTVRGIPPGTTDLVVEFNDSDYPPLSTDGGHGSIRVAVPPGATQTTVPAVPGETNTLPAGVVKEESHRGPMSPGTAYLPPCSGGRGHSYFADVKAVTRPAAPADRGKLLGTGRITLGRY